MQAEEGKVNAEREQQQEEQEEQEEQGECEASDA